MDLTIQQRRRPLKRRLFQVVLLLKRSEFRSELKREDRARDQTEMVEFIALAFPSSSTLKICHFKS